ncbi:MAG: hypothetical protein AB7Q29_09555 [Vicinamibacterales bacterium]
MTPRAGVSRRNFLRFKPVDRGRTIELSLRSLFAEAGDAENVLDDVLLDLGRQLEGVRVLKLFEPEWLESLAGAARVRTVLADFEARGGRVEEQW